MKRLAVLLLLAILLSRPAAALAQAGAPLVISAGQHVVGSVATLAQDIRVEGAVDGDVTSWSGAITIAGSVGGDVVSYGGPIAIMPGARVDGHVLASGGELQVAPQAVVAGRAIRGEGGGDALASMLDIFSPAANTANGTVGRGLFGAALGVLLLAFCFLYSAFWPRRLAITSATLQQFTARALGMGVLTTLALALALPPLAALLIASVLGLPVLLLLLALSVAAYVYGLAVLARWMDRSTSLAPAPSARTLAVAGALVLAITICAIVQPFYGLALFALLASPGLGAAILSRGGMAVPVAAR